jgi:predicted DNA-binding transcriptional regulator YafY
MSRNFQALRILNLFFLLCKHRHSGLTIGFICESLEVNKRTLYRDLSALKEVGVKIVHQRDEDASIRVYVKSIPVLLE